MNFAGSMAPESMQTITRPSRMNDDTDLDAPF